jgi:DNA-binding PadR family transcriptional regulator
VCLPCYFEVLSGTTTRLLHKITLARVMRAIIVNCMSSIRLFILSSFAELGPMHGHRLRLEAELEHVHLWTDISVGAVYGAMNRLVAEGLLRKLKSERKGKRPPRQLYEITEEGQRELAVLRKAGLSEVWFKYDPFDLALTRTDPDTVDMLPSVLAERLDKVRALLTKSKRINEQARDSITLAEEWAVRHTQYRLEAEIAYLTDLLAAASKIVADKRKPHPRKLVPGR